MTIDDIIDGILRAEGGYVNDPRDAGGETNFGVTLKVARANGYAGPMRLLPEGTARAIYRKRYVDEPGFGDVLAVYPRVGEELVDTGVNMGTAVAATFLQRALNALNDQGKHYPDIRVDGDCGPGTLKALRAFRAKRGAAGETVLLRALNCLQGERYIDLAEKRAANEAFLYGWLGNRVALA